MVKKTDKQGNLNAILKDIEKTLFAIKFYPVAVDEKSKNEAVEKIIRIHNKGEEPVRQMVLYMIHENIAKSADFKVMHTFDYFKTKTPTKDPGQLRMNVYHAMFNYNTSIEGVCELFRLLGRFRGDDAAKLLTYHYSRLSTYENECNHILRGAVLEALGESESPYALRALIEYAKYVESERTIKRVVKALLGWDEKLVRLKIKDKEKLQAELREVLTKETGGTHYG